MIRNKERAGDVRLFTAYVRHTEREIERLAIVPRSPHRYPFDILGLATLSKAFSIAKACLKLLSSGFPDEAYGLSRSLVECAANLRYLTAIPTEKDKRSRDFVKFAKADKAFWYHHAMESAKTAKEKVELRAYANQMGIANDPKLARQHWSGEAGSFVWNTTVADHPLDGASTADYRKKAYAVDYYQTSGFVHCSVPAIGNYFVEDGVPLRLSSSSRRYRKTLDSTLFVIVIYVYHVVGYVLYGLNADRPRRLDLLYRRALQNHEAMQK